MVQEKIFFFSDGSSICGAIELLFTHSRSILRAQISPSQSATDPFQHRGACDSSAAYSEGGTALPDPARWAYSAPLYIIS